MWSTFAWQLIFVKYDFHLLSYLVRGILLEQCVSLNRKEVFGNDRMVTILCPIQGILWYHNGVSSSRLFGFILPNSFLNFDTHVLQCNAIQVWQLGKPVSTPWLLLSWGISAIYFSMSQLCCSSQKGFSLMDTRLWFGTNFSFDDMPRCNKLMIAMIIVA